MQKHRFYRLLYYHVFCVRSFPAADTPILRRPVFRWCCKEIHFSRRKSRAAVPGGSGQQCGCGDSSRQKDLGLRLGFLCQEPAVSAASIHYPGSFAFRLPLLAPRCGRPEQPCQRDPSISDTQAPLAKYKPSSRTHQDFITSLKLQSTCRSEAK
ncbi:hypothetical protein F7725_026407 [Dissostichus mawsoni]|uniref:Uncharacterized protein n=1 Tax=Dissostichus mawsoni TaxID=36200 RepID=A0A7J5X700_DISMA|nr:hypothetical protein F7725_026407 [Dissostichus mawsoni]